LNPLLYRFDGFTRETRHSNCVGSLHGVDDTVGKDIGSSEGHKEDC